MSSKRNKRISVHDTDHSYHNKSIEKYQNPIESSMTLSSPIPPLSSSSLPLISTLSPISSLPLSLNSMPPMVVKNLHRDGCNGGGGGGFNSDPCHQNNNNNNNKTSFKKRLLKAATALSEHSYHHPDHLEPQNQEKDQSMVDIDDDVPDTEEEETSKPVTTKPVTIFDYSRPYVLTYSKLSRKHSKSSIKSSSNDDGGEDNDTNSPNQELNNVSHEPHVTSSSVPNFLLNQPPEPQIVSPIPIVKTEPIEIDPSNQLEQSVNNTVPPPQSQQQLPRRPPKLRKSFLEEEHSYHHVSKSPPTTAAAASVADWPPTPPNTEQVSSSSSSASAAAVVTPETDYNNNGSMNSSSFVCGTSIRQSSTLFADNPNHHHANHLEDDIDNETTSLNAMDEAFGRYVISCLRGMTPAKRNQARIKIVKVLNQSI